MEEGDFKDYMNPDSLYVIHNALAEPSLADAGPAERFQFLRKGYFCLDKESTPDKLVFNRTVSLKDGWAKETKKG
jgi:glutaminyl-tRNA synthetase